MFKFADGMMVVRRATKPTFEELKSVPEIVSTAPILTPNFPNYPRRFTINNDSSIINKYSVYSHQQIPKSSTWFCASLAVIKLWYSGGGRKRDGC